MTEQRKKPSTIEVRAVEDTSLNLLDVDDETAYAGDKGSPIAQPSEDGYITLIIRNFLLLYLQPIFFVLSRQITIASEVDKDELTFFHPSAQPLSRFSKIFEGNPTSTEKYALKQSEGKPPIQFPSKAEALARLKVDRQAILSKLVPFLKGKKISKQIRVGEDFKSRVQNQESFSIQILRHEVICGGNGDGPSISTPIGLNLIGLGMVKQASGLFSLVPFLIVNKVDHPGGGKNGGMSSEDPPLTLHPKLFMSIQKHCLEQKGVKNIDITTPKKKSFNKSLLQHYPQFDDLQKKLGKPLFNACAFEGCIAKIDQEIMELKGDMINLYNKLENRHKGMIACHDSAARLEIIDPYFLSNDTTSKNGTKEPNEGIQQQTNLNLSPKSASHSPTYVPYQMADESMVKNGMDTLSQNQTTMSYINASDPVESNVKFLLDDIEQPDSNPEQTMDWLLKLHANDTFLIGKMIKNLESELTNWIGTLHSEFPGEASKNMEKCKKALKMLEDLTLTPTTVQQSIYS